LLDAALKMRCRTALRPWTYYCLIGLLSVSGLRLGEALNLELQDVDLQAAVLTIKSGKFGKSRLVPLHRSTRDVLADYMARRNRFAAGRSISSYLFVSSRGKRLNVRAVHDTFNTLSHQVGLRGPSDNHGPRLHDFRHHADSPIMPTPYVKTVAGGARIVCGIGIIRGSLGKPTVCHQAGIGWV